MRLSKDQKEVANEVLDWMKKGKSPFLTLGGYAGTGKTTLIAFLRNKLRKQYKESFRVAFACFTGKAGQVLGNTLAKKEAIFPHDYTGTIHGLMYKPVIDNEGKLLYWSKVERLDYDLIIIDEASMVTREIWADILQYGIPILAVGDHGQLPPIGDGFNLMEKPELKLEQIHRQAKNHPIIALSEEARKEGMIDYKMYSQNVFKIRKYHKDVDALKEKLFKHFHQDMLVLCGYNRSRVNLNKDIRMHLGKKSEEPIIDDYVICLKNNYKDVNDPIYNGMIGKLKTIKPFRKHWYKASIYFFNEQRYHYGKLSKYQFNSPVFIDEIKGIRYDRIGDRFDFGYALTVHKAQGSQAKTVLLFDEYKTEDEAQYARWLYTAITRASDNLYIIA